MSQGAYHFTDTNILFADNVLTIRGINTPAVAAQMFSEMLKSNAKDPVTRFVVGNPDIITVCKRARDVFVDEDTDFGYLVTPITIAACMRSAIGEWQTFYHGPIDKFIATYKEQ